jgi:hypothetical protein
MVFLPFSRFHEMAPEQELKIKIFALRVSALSEAETKEMLISKFEEMLRLSNFYKKQISRAWGIEP